MKNYDTLSPSLNRTKSNISSLFIPKSNTFSFVTFILFRNMPPERDISVLKLLGFETFVNFWRASVSVPENLVLEKKTRFQKTTLGIGFGQIFGLVIQCIPLDHIWLADFPTVYFLQFCHGRQQAVVTPWGWTIFELLFLWDQTTSNLLAYNLQIPYKYYHWDCSSRWEIWRLGQDSQERHDWHFNLTSQDTCEGQLSQFLRWLFIGL